MNALRKIGVEGRGVCEALAVATPWPAIEWARAIVALADAGLFPTIGFEQVLTISRASGKPPLDVANDLIAYAAQIVAEAQSAGS